MPMGGYKGVAEITAYFTRSSSSMKLTPGRLSFLTKWMTSLPERWVQFSAWSRLA